jgi:multicomponent Na+:H+ antiporter subunit E
MAKVSTFLILYAFWIFLSGMFDFVHLFLGALAALLVTIMSSTLLFSPDSPSLRPGAVFGMVRYLPWLFKEIVVANLQVAYIVLHPRMLDLIDPQLIRFRTRLRRPFSRVTFAQSITLTPGTVTVSVREDEFTVFALTNSAAASLPGEMEQRVASCLEGN